MTEHKSSSSSVTDRRNIADIYPLSPMQSGILYHALSEGETGVYVPQTAQMITGPVDTDALRRAWQSAVDRHPVLRTAFFWEERDEPFQIVFKKVPLEWHQLDWSDRTQTESMALRELFARTREMPFDLRRPSQLRVQWINLGAERSILHVSYHHIILDGWSVRQLLDEIMRLYCRETGIANLPLTSPPPYADYIGWLKSRDGNTSNQFWQEYLAGYEKKAALASKSGGDAFERRSWSCSDSLHARLKHLCSCRSLTISTLLQGALGLVMARAAGRNDIVFGTTVSGRPSDLAGATTMIGLFINTLPVRVRLAPDLPVGDWLTGLQMQQAETLDHHHVPLSQIQGRGGGLFDTLLVVENFHGGGSRIDSLPFRVENVDFDERTHFSLTIWARPEANSLHLLAGSDCLPCSDLDELLKSIGAALERFAQEPESNLAEHMRTTAAPKVIADTIDDPTEWFLPANAAPSATPIATDTEAAVARAFTEVLKCGPVNRATDFFELGGHSLLAARIVSRLRSEFSIAIPVRAVFDHPHLADLASHIDELRAANAADTNYVDIEI
ncbi:condensation domain-containing protein [Fulvimarina sp. MAC8]|uniref:condensation domain-containing protein n=1 Tax=Fulvimarina sp. MAC8 TaxID=3162874 RepID=UPI0032ED21F7